LRTVVLIPILTASAFAAQTVDGHVVNSVTGADVAGARVQFLPVEDGDRYQATTDAQGRFRMEGVHEGRYIVLYSARGYWGEPLPLGGEPAPPAIVGGQPVQLERKLQPIPRISGRVLEVAGQPVAGAPVWALWNERGCSAPDCFPVVHKTETDDKGAYAISDIEAPGNWLLSAAAPASLKPPETDDGQRLAWTQTFYPDVTDPQLGMRITVRPGADLFNIDIKLAAVPVRRIRGRVVDSAGKPVGEAAVALGRGFGANLQGQTDHAGTFEFASVPDADWRIAASVDAGSDKLWGTRLLTVEGHDPEPIELRLAEPFVLGGKFVFETPEDIVAPDPPHVILGTYSEIRLPADPQTRERFLGPTVDGEFSIDNVYPGQYEITVLEPPPPPFYLDSIRLGVHDAVAADVPIASDAERLTLTYKYGGGTVRGAIEGCGSAKVFLIPQQVDLRRDQFIRFTPCGANGSFEFAGVRPGTYYGIAIAGHISARFRELGADDRLLNQSTTLTVRPNESTSTKIPMVER